VGSELKKEFTALSDAAPYFGNGGSGTGLGGALFGSTSSAGIVSSMVGATATALKNVNAPPTTTVSVNTSDLMELLGSVASITAVIVPEAALPLGLLSGVLGGMGDTGLLNASSNGLSYPNYQILATADQLATNTTVYLTNAPAAYDATLDNLYSDGTKLLTVGENVITTWRLPNELGWDKVGQYIISSANENFTLQLLSAVYSVDYWPNQGFQVNDLSQLGGTKTKCGVDGRCESYCNTWYPGDTPANGWHAFPNASFTVDFFYIGGAIQNNGTQYMTEDAPPPDLLTTLFSAKQFNLPVDQFYGPGGPIARRNPPQYGRGYCTVSSVSTTRR
jgi:hypothetical protein